MMGIRDLLRPVAAVAGAATLAAGAAVVGYVVLSRDRERLKRAVRMAAGAVERASFAFAEAREELGDLWAEAREEARHDIEEQAFAGAQADEPPADAGSAAPEATPKPRKARAPGVKRAAGAASSATAKRRSGRAAAP